MKNNRFFNFIKKSMIFIMLLLSVSFVINIFIQNNSRKNDSDHVPKEKIESILDKIKPDAGIDPSKDIKNAEKTVNQEDYKELIYNGTTENLAISDEYLQSLHSNSGDYDKPVSALLQVESVGILQKVYSDISPETLEHGVGTILQKGEFGNGTLSLAGHTSTTDRNSPRFLTPLNNIKEKAIAKIVTKNWVYEYEYTGKFIVEISDTEAVWPREGKNELNLVKCTDDALQREVYKFNFVKKVSRN